MTATCRTPSPSSRGRFRRKESGAGGRETRKPSHPSNRMRKALHFLRTLSVEELDLSVGSWAGFLAFGSSPDPLPSRPAQRGTVAGFVGQKRIGSPITVAGPRPICTAFPFLPELDSGSPQELGFQRTINHRQAIIWHPATSRCAAAGQGRPETSGSLEAKATPRASAPM